MVSKIHPGWTPTKNAAGWVFPKIPPLGYSMENCRYWKLLTKLPQFDDVVWRISTCLSRSVSRPLPQVSRVLWLDKDKVPWLSLLLSHWLLNPIILKYGNSKETSTDSHHSSHHLIPHRSGRSRGNTSCRGSEHLELKWAIISNSKSTIQTTTNR